MADRGAENETKFRLLVENAHDLMAILDDSGICLYVSPACRTLLGCEPESLAGRLILDFVHPMDADLLREHVRGMLDSAVRKPIRFRMRRRDESYLWVEASARLVPGSTVGRSHEIIVVCRDAGAQVQLEGDYRKALECAQQLLEAARVERADQCGADVHHEAKGKTLASDQVLQLLRALVMAADSAGRIIHIGPSVEEMLGYKPEDLVGEQWWERMYRDPVERQRRKDTVMRMAKGELSPPQAPYEQVMIHGNGSSRWFLWHDMSGPDGQVIRVGQDITESKLLEQQLRQAQKMEAVGRLAGGIAHDFNNLLTAIQSYSEHILTQFGETDPLRRAVMEIKKAGDRAANLTRQLLAFSRTQVLEPRNLDLNTILADIEDLIRRLLGEDIELVTFLQPALGRIRADPGQLEQVILNLVINARDAMPAGGKLVIGTADAPMDEDEVRKRPGMVPGRYVLLALSDTGQGMDAATLARIFEPFFTTKEVDTATGLGLSTAYAILKQSGGYIFATSEAGRGATFEVYLPRVEDQSP